MVMKEKDDELALFLELRRREKEKERDNNFLLLNNSDDGANPGSSPPASRIVPSTMLPRKTAAEKFLDSENDKSDYDWLLTPPGTPLFPSLEMESHKTMMGQREMPNARPTALKSRLMNDLDEPAPRNNVAASKRTTLQSGVNSSSAGNRRPSSAGGTRAASRPATPTGRPSLPSTAKPSRASTPTSRATLPLTKPAPPPARSSTPTRTTARSSTPTSTAVRSSTPTSTAARSSTPTSTAARSSTPTSTAARSSTPTSTAARSSTPTSTAARSSTPTRTTARSSTPTRTTARSSTPTARPSAPGPKPMPRSATPTRLPSTNPSAPSSVAPPGRSSSSTKSRPTALKNPVLSRGSSPTVKSRPWKPNEMPGFSHDAPPNLRTSLPQRPASASRGRPGVASARSSSVDTASNGKPRQQSCSPARGRAPIGNANSSRISMPVKSRPQIKNIDDVNPVLMGTQMVERVVNMRKLAPPKHDDHHSTLSGSAGKSSSLDSSGFGRSLSKKSLDMALRHMDIRRSMNSGSLRPLMTNIPASSMYSVRSGGSTRSRSISVSDSPHATSSNSSEPSVNNNNFFADSVDMEDVDFGSERGISSPTSHRSSR